jgi:hypothetical protein
MNIEDVEDQKKQNNHAHTKYPKHGGTYGTPCANQTITGVSVSNARRPRVDTTGEQSRHQQDTVDGS